MKPITFDGQNTLFAKDQPEYQTLPAHLVRDNEGTVISCWQLSWRERFRLLFTGRLWCMVMTFNGPLQPQLLRVDKPDMQDPWVGPS